MKTEKQKWEAILEKHNLAVIDGPQHFTPPKHRSKKAQTQVRDALAECLINATQDELSQIDMHIAEKYAHGTSYRKIADELREMGLIDLHFSNVQRRLQRILTHFASKTLVGK